MNEALRQTVMWLRALEQKMNSTALIQTGGCIYVHTYSAQKRLCNCLFARQGIRLNI